MTSQFISFEIIVATKDIILIFAAIITAKVAIDGLQSWSRELRGKANFEVARNLIRSTYKLRDELSYCRSPWKPINEFPKGYDLMKHTQSGAAEAYSYLYINRWKLVAVTSQEFEAHALEAVALWGHEFKHKTDEMRQCVRILQVSIEVLLANYANDGGDFKFDPDFEKKIKNDVEEVRKDQNPLTLRINAAIQAIENEIRPHIKRY